MPRTLGEKQEQSLAEGIASALIDLDRIQQILLSMADYDDAGDVRRIRERLSNLTFKEVDEIEQRLRRLPKLTQYEREHKETPNDD